MKNKNIKPGVVIAVIVASLFMIATLRHQPSANAILDQEPIDTKLVQHADTNKGSEGQAAAQRIYDQEPTNSHLVKH